MGAIESERKFVAGALRRYSATSSQALTCCIALSVSPGNRDSRSPVASVVPLALADSLLNLPVRKCLQVGKGEGCTVCRILFEAVATRNITVRSKIRNSRRHKIVVHRMICSVWIIANNFRRRQKGYCSSHQIHFCHRNQSLTRVLKIVYRVLVY